VIDSVPDHDPTDADNVEPSRVAPVTIGNDWFVGAVRGGGLVGGAISPVGDELVSWSVNSL
jgi:hypothetical protein